MRNIVKIGCLVVALGVSTQGFSGFMDNLSGAVPFSSTIHHSLFNNAAGAASGLKNGASALTSGFRSHLPSVGGITDKVGDLTSGIRSHLPGLDNLKDGFGTVSSKLGGFIGSAKDTFSSFAFWMLIKQGFMKVAGLTSNFLH
jgi:phage-related protein